MNDDNVKSKNFYIIISVVAVIGLIGIFLLFSLLFGGKKKNDTVVKSKSLLSPTIFSNTEITEPVVDPNTSQVISQTEENIQNITPEVTTTTQPQGETQQQTTNPNTNTNQTSEQTKTQTPTTTPTTQPTTPTTPTQTEVPTTTQPQESTTCTTNPSTGSVECGTSTTPQTSPGWISINLPKTRCMEGEVISGYVETGGATNGSSISTINSNKPNLASIEFSRKQNKACTSNNCAGIDVTCRKEGNVTLSATSTTGVTTTTDLLVKGFLLFNGNRDEVIHCTPNTTVMAYVTVEDADEVYTFADYDSEISAIAFIGEYNNGPNDRSNYKSYIIKCRKAGETRVTVSLTNGASITARVRVIDK